MDIFICNYIKESNDICNHFKFLQNQCRFLVPCPIEHIIFAETRNIKDDKKDKKNDIYDEVYWILKYILYCRYDYYQLNFLEVKKIVFTILQFLYFTSNIKLSHLIDEPINNP